MGIKVVDYLLTEDESKEREIEELQAEIVRLRAQLATAKKIMLYAIECDEATQPTIYYESRLMWRSHQLAEITNRSRTVLKELGGDE